MITDRMLRMFNKKKAPAAAKSSGNQS
jgi:hypothetical protein